MPLRAQTPLEAQVILGASTFLKNIRSITDDITIATNPSSNLILGSGIAPLYSFVKNNINVSIGTDGAASNNNLNISISGKDKMCRLNGEVSGNIMMSTDFGTIEEVVKADNGETITTITKLPIY